MKHELILFAICLGIGIVFRVIFKCITLAEKKINSKVATIILDIMLAFISVGAIAATVFFLNNGIVMPYMLISSIIGFTLVSIVF